MSITAVRDIIDTASAEYAQAWARAQEGLSRLVERMLKNGANSQQVAETLATVDFQQLVGRDLGMGQALKDLQGAYREVLVAMPGRNPVTEATLKGLQSFTSDSVLAGYPEMAARMKGETIKALLAGGRTSDVRAALGAEMERYRADAIANTTLNTFSRSVEYEMAKLDPEDALYVYEGPVDDRTRDECLAMAAAGALTRAEVEDQFPGAFIDGGGWNCRHSWVPAEAADMTDQEGAKERIGE